MANVRKFFFLLFQSLHIFLFLYISAEIHLSLLNHSLFYWKGKKLVSRSISHLLGSLYFFLNLHKELAKKLPLLFFALSFADRKTSLVS